MPGLVMFNRRWRIGSDDFVFPAFADIILRIFWFCVVLVEFLKYREQWDCGGGGQWLHTYVKYSITSLSVVMFFDILIAWTSSRGTIVQDKPRRHLPKILYLRLLVMISEAVWNGFGTKWAFTFHDHSCEPRELVIFVQIVCVCSWLLLGLMLVGILLVFDPNGSFRSVSVSGGQRVADVERNEPQPMYINLNSSPSVEKAKKVWEWQLRMFCCCCKSRDEQSESAYSAISKLFAQHFEEDLVPSDIAVGLILLQQKQAAENLSRQSEDVSAQSPDSLDSTGAVQGSLLSSPGAFAPSCGQSWMSPAMAAHFMKFALGSYGWPLFLYANCCSGMCQMGKAIRCRCCCRRRRPSDPVSDDDFLDCRWAALLSSSGLSEQDLVFASFRNGVYESPFFVALDHPTRCVVVAVRGTLSPSDALTDLSAECAPLRAEGCPRGAACHRGMLQAALFVARRLEESGALGRALALHQGYSVAVTGHSLGAGVAALLSLLLRPTHPGLRCFAFSPPGGLLSREAARHSEDFAMGVVVGDDAVPRLSVASVDALKKKILDCVEACDAPKYKVFLQQLAKCFGQKKIPDREADSNSRPLLEHLGHTVNNYTTDGSQSSECLPVPLYLPGRILHLTRAPSGIHGRWVTAEHFDQIVVSPRMLSDHMPHAVHDALRQLAHQEASFVP